LRVDIELQMADAVLEFDKTGMEVFWGVVRGRNLEGLWRGREERKKRGSRHQRTVMFGKSGGRKWGEVFEGCNGHFTWIVRNLLEDTEMFQE
jgi:hypothetical protein